MGRAARAVTWGAIALSVACTALSGVGDLGVGKDGDVPLGDGAVAVLPDGRVVDARDGGPILPATDAECGDTSASSEHCGACGHSCAGGACRAGMCVPTVLASEQARPTDVVAAMGSVYWTVAGLGLNVGSVRALRAGASEVVTLATGEGLPEQLIHVDGALYWTNWYSNNTLVRSLVDGGARTPLVLGQGGGDGVAAGSGRLYWSLNPFGTTGIHRVLGALDDGGAIVEYASDDAGLQYGGPVIGASSVYWTEERANGRVMRVTVGAAPAAAAPVVIGQGRPRSITTDGAFVYWVADDPLPSILRVPIAGGPPTRIVGPLPALGRLAVDDTSVYVIDREKSQILRAPKTGGSPTPIVTALVSPQSIFVDDRFVYWTTLGPNNGDDAKGTVAKVVK